MSPAEVAGGDYGCGERDARVDGGFDGVERSRGVIAAMAIALMRVAFARDISGGACDFKGASGDGGGGSGGFQCGYGGVRGGGNDGCCCAGEQSATARL